MNLEAEIRADLARYTDSFGLICSKPGEGSGNAPLFTAHAYLMLKKLGLLTQSDREAAHRALTTCWVVPGLLRRHPVAYVNDQEGPDDYHGLASLSSQLGLPHASQALAYGWKCPGKLRWHGYTFSLSYNYNNIHPGLVERSSWLGRQPQLVALLMYASGETPRLWRRLWLAGVVLLACRTKRDNHDGWILTYHAIHAVDGRSWLVNWAAKRFKKALFRSFPGGGMRELFGEYFGNREHPLAKWWPTY